MPSLPGESLEITRTSYSSLNYVELLTSCSQVTRSSWTAHRWFNQFSCAPGQAEEKHGSTYSTYINFIKSGPRSSWTRSVWSGLHKKRRVQLVVSYSTHSISTQSFYFESDRRTSIGTFLHYFLFLKGLRKKFKVSLYTLKSEMPDFQLYILIFIWIMGERSWVFSS